jgi:Tfp pilus assembly protein PilF
MHKRLKASLGYLELGVAQEAWDELEEIPAEEGSHPVVLRMRVEIYRALGKWAEMSEIAGHLVKVEPGQPDYWISLAWGQRGSIGIPEAEKTLAAAAERFPQEATIHFNLACYSCKQGRLDEARGRLKTAIELEPAFKEAALQDDDLEAIWQGV